MGVASIVSGSRSCSNVDDQDDLHSSFDFSVNDRLVHAIILCSIRFLLEPFSIMILCGEHNFDLLNFVQFLLHSVPWGCELPMH